MLIRPVFDVVRLQCRYVAILAGKFLQLVQIFFGKRLEYVRYLVQKLLNIFNARRRLILDHILSVVFVPEKFCLIVPVLDHVFDYLCIVRLDCLVQVGGSRIVGIVNGFPQRPIRRVLQKALNDFVFQLNIPWSFLWI